MSTISILSPDMIFKCLKRGNMNRIVACTKMNTRSSRSHTIFRLELTCFLLDGACSHAKLNLVDLAGSERVGKTGATGDQLQEAKNINMSLTTLGKCISTLISKNTDLIPFRESKLTQILKESLGGNSVTTLVCSCSNSVKHAEESQQTMDFAMRAQNVKCTHSANIMRSPEELQRVIDELKREIAFLKSNAGSGNIIDQTPDEWQMKYIEVKAKNEQLENNSYEEILRLKTALAYCQVPDAKSTPKDKFDFNQA